MPCPAGGAIIRQPTCAGRLRPPHRGNSIRIAVRNARLVCMRQSKRGSANPDRQETNTAIISRRMTCDAV
ncbi:hypothetical protein DF121_29225 [Burkholderia stagnalis]|nr:hypothetical protein DF145_27210 [Burkholderia stagnalis]RQX90606.1 hypothetical protein DF121_29225 [Burkholderia stagnalis]RQY10294.1 hypothetical protein DF115_28010 [Burkholderia stagnalis]RQY26540.1 hypothetical protein DF114_27050 [Burkholderia stagnalis]